MLFRSFYFENFDEYNRAWGNIVKLFIDRYVMYVFQTSNTGVVPVSPELSVFLGQGNIPLLGDLCDWYDCPDSWKYDTKNMGTDTIEGLFFNLLGGTAPEWLPSMLPTEAVGGGFTSRVIWVVEEGKRKSVVDPKIDPELQEALMYDIQRIKLMNGEMHFSAPAKARYDAWYLTEEAKIEDGKPPIQDPKFEGYCSRRATMLYKLCCIITASEGDYYTIEERHFERALSLLERTERKMAKAFSTLGTARYNQAVEMILNFVLKQKQVTRSQVLRFLYRDVDEFTFDIAVRTLEKMKMITVEHDHTSKEVILSIVDSARSYRY